VKPKKTSVGWPRNDAGVAGESCVSRSANGARTRGCGNAVPDSSAGTVGWLTRRLTYTPAIAAAAAIAPTEIQ
jgi:hypothetical protein